MTAPSRAPQVDAAARAHRPRQLDRDHQLSARQRRYAGAHEELVEEEPPGPFRTGGDDPGAVGEQCWRGVGRWRGVAQVADEGRAIPDLDRTHEQRRFGERRVVALDPGVSGDFGHRSECPYAQIAVLVAKVAVQLGDALDVDHDLRTERAV